MKTKTCGKERKKHALRRLPEETASGNIYFKKGISVGILLSWLIFFFLQFALWGFWALWNIRNVVMVMLLGAYYLDVEPG
jgi:hypothetical protein